ncbi:MAG: hypothetical protein AAF636_19455 [Pseudomonadota bacterium]
MCFANEGLRSRNLVFCSGIKEGTFGPKFAKTHNWKVYSYSSQDCALSQIDTLEPDAIAVEFDAFEPSSMDFLRELAAKKRNGAPLIVTYAGFNPNWIENLTSQAGGDLHINCVPSLEFLVDRLNMYFSNNADVNLLGQRGWVSD